MQLMGKWGATVIYEQSTQHLTLIRKGTSGWVVLEREDGQRFDFPAEWLPAEALQGDVLILRRKQHRSDCNLRLFVNLKARRQREEAPEAETESENAPKDSTPL